MFRWRHLLIISDRLFRWQVWFKDIEMYGLSERYDLKTLKCPKQVKELVPFENDLTDMLKVTKFQKVKTQFLTKLKNDIKTVK